MKQAFPMAAILNLAGLFDGSNRVRGQIDAANARKAIADADMAEYRTKLRDPSFVKEQAYLNLTGGDTGKVKQILDWQNSPDLPTIQGTGESLSGVTQGVGLPPITAKIPESPLTPEGGLKVATGIMPESMKSVSKPAFFTPEMEQAATRQFQNLNLGGLFGMNARQAVQNQLDFEEQDKNTLYQAAAMNMLRQGNIDGANAITSVSNGKAYLPNSMTSNGLMYNKATGQVDASNPYAQAKIGEIGARANLIGAQTQGEYLNHRKTQVEIAKINQAIQSGNFEYAKQATGILPELYTSEAVDPKTGIKTKVFDSARYLADVNKALQMSSVQSPRDLAMAVQSGHMTPDQADALARQKGWD